MGSFFIFLTTVPFFKVEMWPICRDSSVQGCKISSENPVLPNKDLKVVPGNGMVEVDDEVEIKCKDQSEVTDEFQSLKVVSQFNSVVQCCIPKQFFCRIHNFIYC